MRLTITSLLIRITSLITSIITVTSLIVASFSLQAQAQAQTVLPQDAKALCTVSTTTFKTWFRGNISLHGTVYPANSINFPNKENCDFYLWAQQMFLWLTSPAPSNYGGGSMVLSSPVFYNVSGLDSQGKRRYAQNLPNSSQLILNVRAAQTGPNGLQSVNDTKGQRYEILPAALASSGRSLIKNHTGQQIEVHRIDTNTGNKPIFFDAQNKKIHLPLQTTFDLSVARRVAPHLISLENKFAQNIVQAFRDNAGKIVLIDVHGNNVVPSRTHTDTAGVLISQNQSLVYYATMVNDVYAYFQTGIANGSIPNPNNISAPGVFPTALFPSTQAELDPVIAYAASKKYRFPAKESLVMEIKTAWIDMTGISTLGLKSSDYLSVKAAVPEYDKRDPQLWMPTGKFKTLNLALVGMHVVGSVKGHPEMIWASFEHVSNAPNAAYTYINTVDKTRTVPQQGAGKWLFAAANASSYNLQKAKFCTEQELDTHCTSAKMQSIVALVNTGIGASNTLRLKAFGSGANAKNASLLNTEIISSNNSVHNQLLKGDLRANYIMTGATWTKEGEVVTPNNQQGSNRLTNTTMETYDQGIDSSKNSGSNCLSCHQNATQTSGQKANTKVSHIFNKLVPLFPR